MIFNSIQKDYILLRGKRTPFFAHLKRSLTGMDHRLLKTDRGPRIVPVLVHFEYDDFSHFERIKEDMAKWLVHEKPKILEFEDDPDRFYWAVVDGSIEYDNPLPTATDAKINFICGYKYSHERTVTINPTATKLIEGHKSTPWRTKTTFTANQTGYELQFYSPGKTDLREINIIKLNYNFVSGDVLEIDYLKRAVTLNGIDRSNLLVILQSNYMELPIGNVEFSSSVNTNLFYNERYY